MGRYVDKFQNEWPPSSEMMISLTEIATLDIKDPKQVPVIILYFFLFGI